MKISNSLEGQLADKQHGSLSQLVSSRYSGYRRITSKELILATNIYDSSRQYDYDIFFLRHTPSTYSKTESVCSNIVELSVFQ